MNNRYTRYQAALNPESDAALIAHFDAVQNEFASLTSQSDVIRFILERDRQVSNVYGVAWDWRIVIKAPPWLEKLLGAIKAFDGRARVVVEDSEDVNQKITIGDGIFDE